MATLDLKINHALPEAEAQKRIKGMLQNVKRQFGNHISDLEEKWQGNTGHFKFKVKGMQISGDLVVAKKSIHIKGGLPFAASFFKGKIESIIREQGEALLS